MILKSIDEKIRQAFSDAALQYDALTSLHKEIGRDLIKTVRMHEPCARILDIGMGTGWLTTRLAHLFPGSVVVGLDFAQGMIDQAKQQGEDIRILQADAGHLPFQKNSFDIIISNLAYQWIEDIPRAFQQCSDTLNKTGVLSLTLFGHQTLQELFVALEQSQLSADQGKILSVRRLATLDEVKAALAHAGFIDAIVDYERIKVRFPDMLGLIKWTKSIGANSLEKNVFIGKEWLSRANEYYNKNFCDHLGVYTTFEVIWVFAKKNGVGHKTQDTRHR